MTDLGRGKITLEEFKEILDSRDRTRAGDSAKPEGLALSKIVYPYINEHGFDIDLAAEYLFGRKKSYYDSLDERNATAEFED
jgi:tRNA U38,U39,U40 pseudouridine synthase TruA